MNSARCPRCGKGGPRERHPLSLANFAVVIACVAALATAGVAVEFIATHPKLIAQIVLVAVGLAVFGTWFAIKGRDE